MNPDEKELLTSLLDEYREASEILREAQFDLDSYRQEVYSFFKAHNIKEYKHKDKIFKLFSHVYYKYPYTCKRHAKELQTKESVKMTNKKL